MDGRGFDQWSRTLSRRRVPALLAGLLAAPAGLAGPSAKAKPRTANGRGKRCKRPKKTCGTRCVNPKSDRRHCGGCGRKCPGALSCRNGACAPKFKLQWSTAEPGSSFLSPRGVAVADNGDIWVADQELESVFRYSPAGAFRERLNVPPGARLMSANAVALAPDDNLWVVEIFEHRIRRFTTAGEVTGQLGSVEGNQDGTFNNPYGVAVAPPGSPEAGRVYITDIDNHRVQSYANSLNPASYRKWGSEGSAAGEFQFPRGIAVAKNGEVFVTDGDNGRVQVFSPTGAFLREWGSPGTGNGQFLRPEGITIGPDGAVYVTDFNADRVQVFSPAGRFLGKWGAGGSDPGEFWGPYAIAIARNGRIYVSDNINDRMQVFG